MTYGALTQSNACRRWPLNANKITHSDNILTYLDVECWEDHLHWIGRNLNRDVLHHWYLETNFSSWSLKTAQHHFFMLKVVLAEVSGRSRISRGGTNPRGGGANVNKVEVPTDRLWMPYNEITGFQQPVTESKFPGLTLIPTRMWTKQENAELLSMSLTIYCGWLTYMKLNGNNLE